MIKKQILQPKLTLYNFVVLVRNSIRKHFKAIRMILLS